LKYAFDLGGGVNASFILDGNVSARNGLAGYEGDVKLSAQSVFTYSMVNLTGSSNGKDGYKLALKATAGASSTVTFAGESEFSFNAGFGLAITGDKVILDVAKFSFEKSSARENIDGAFYLFDVKFPFSITDNVITGNTGPAITLDGEAFAHIDSNQISGNGTAVLLKNLATAKINNNTINGNAKGISIAGTSTGTLISENSIFNNTGLAIDLGDDGVTPIMQEDLCLVQIDCRTIPYSPV
jgi:parallel beta-helix repeat protein